MTKLLQRILPCLVLLFVCPGPALAQDPVRFGLYGYDIPPYAFHSKGKLVGIEIDVLKELEKRVGRPIEIVMLEEMPLTPAVAANKVDFCLGGPFDPSLEEFSKFLSDKPLETFLFRNKNNPSIITPDDVAGKIIGIAYPDFINLMPGLKEAKEIHYYKTQHNATMDLENNTIQAWVATSRTLFEYAIAKNKCKNIERVGGPLIRFPLYYVFRKEDKDIMVEFRDAYASMVQDGVIDTIHEYWRGKSYPIHFWEKYSSYVLLGIASLSLFALAVVAWNRQLSRRVGAATSSLSLSERRNRTLIDSSPDMILLLNAQGVLRRTNDAAQKVLGLANVEAGLSVLSHLVEGQRQRFTNFLGDLFAKGHGAEEFCIVDSDGEVRHIEAAGAVIPTDAEEPEACLFARDITRRRNMEEELLHSERLAAIGRMAAGVAHEVNNPMTIIMSNTGAMRTNPASREFDRNLTAIEDNAKRVGDITNRLLALAKNEESIVAAVDILETLEDTLGLLGKKTRGIDVHLAPPEKRLLVAGDRQLLQQAFLNLLVNAIESLHDSEAKRVEITVGQGSRGRARISVTDTGPGIDPEHQHLIYEPFYSSGKHMGFGLGLFLVKTIVKRHDGVIELDSEPGRGTTFHVELPLWNA